MDHRGVLGAQGMQGWRRFTFFDRDDAAAAAQPDALAAYSLQNATCSAAAGCSLAFGKADGSVILLDTATQRTAAFRAHQQALLVMVPVQGREQLATVGIDTAALEVLQLKLWDPAAIVNGESSSGSTVVDAAGSQTAGGGQSSEHIAAVPAATVRLFTSKHPANGTVTAVAVLAAAWPQAILAVGLSNGAVQIMRGEAGKDKWTRTVVSGISMGTAVGEGGTTVAASAAAAAAAPVTGIYFGRPGRASSQGLFIVTAAGVMSVNVDNTAQTLLDERGAAAECSTQDARLCLVVGRSDAISVYSRDARGPVFVFPGEKQRVTCALHYLAVVNQTQPARAPLDGQPPLAQPALLQVFDLRNKLLAGTLEVAAGVRAVLPLPGGIAALAGDGSLLALRERDLATRLDLLFAKGLHGVALNVAEAAKADAGVIAEVHRRAGDALYARRDYGAAVAEYCETVGQLEPSYVIRRFLDAQRIHNLAAYLAHLHAKGLASSDHTTLLLNCYAKLRDTTKLDRFLRATGPDGKPALSFDVDTAIKVCRTAGYHEHALFVAQAAGESAVYLDVLLHDCNAYDEALTYLQGLPRRAAASALRKYGKALVTARPEAATALAMQLCSPTTEGGIDADFVAPAEDFAHIYADRPMALMLLAEFILNSQTEPPGEAWLYKSLLELYLSPRLNDEPAAPSSRSAAASEEQQAAGHTAEERRNNDAASAVTHDAPSSEAAPTTTRMRREQAMELLRRGWPGGGSPRFDADVALVLCRMRGFTLGLLFLYERMRLHREVLRLHMAEGNRAGVIEACLRLGDAHSGGDAHLWMEALQWFGSLDTDCSAEVKEMIRHIEAGSLLPPLVVLKALTPNPHLSLGIVKPYIARQLSDMGARIAEDRAASQKLAAETKQMKAEAHDLQTKARVFQASRCAMSGAPLELPAVHFLCGHSFNSRALGEADGECPLCGSSFRSVLDIRAAMQAGSSEQDRFFTQLKQSADGFSVVADFFGRGLLNNTSVTPSATSARGGL